jgi:hypothetical protein
VPARAIFVSLLFCGCVSADDTMDVTYDACVPLVIVAAGASADELASIDDAIAMWRAQGVDVLTRQELPGAARVPVHFEDALLAFRGQYRDETGEVYVNRRIDDRHARAVTIAHELGHAFGLPHVAASERVSLMNPGNLVVEPTVADRAAIAALWGTCGGKKLAPGP